MRIDDILKEQLKDPKFAQAYYSEKEKSAKEDYDSLIEMLEIESNKYLMKKIRRGQREVDEGKIQQHSLIDPDH